MKRIKYAKEPVLKIHRWVVVVGVLSKKHGYGQSFFYCSNKKEVQCVKMKAPKGAVIEIHKSIHNFVEAWEK